MFIRLKFLNLKQQVKHHIEAVRIETSHKYKGLDYVDRFWIAYGWHFPALVNILQLLESREIEVPARLGKRLKLEGNKKAGIHN